MAMKRGHTAIEYKSKIRRLRQLRPDMSISSDFIIGFPNESEEDFAATMKLIEQVGLIPHLASSIARAQELRLLTCRTMSVPRKKSSVLRYCRLEYYRMPWKSVDAW